MLLSPNNDLVKRKVATALALTGAGLVAGCSSDRTPNSATSPTMQITAPATVAPTASATATAKPVLFGTVGSQDNPDASVINLNDSAGKPVINLPTGTYSITVQDLSEIHNFHLKGGTVDETTTVSEVTDKTFQVSLTAGKYTFVCDPHPRMVGAFTVT